ncbi:MAG: ribose-phosphate diphosphokinase [Candidatus Hodarchaeales archaeon]|jgi:ribose-phosphate pyrophosphokinase
MRVIVVGKPDFAKKLAERIPGSTFLEIEEQIFPDGEICPRLLITDENDLKNTHVIIALQLRLAQSKNEYFLSFLFSIHNVKRYGAKIITCIMPYHIYSRQDRESRLGEPFSSRYLASMLESAGVNNFITVNSHSYGKNLLSDFFNESFAISLSAIPLLSKAIKERINGNTDVLCFSPDEGAIILAKEAAEGINSPFYGALRKTRNPNTGEISQELMGINVSIKDRDIIIVDDLVSSGGTMIGAARIMKQLGAKSVSLAYVHGVHSIKNFKSLQKENFEVILTTDTIKSDIQELEFISIIDLLGKWISSSLLKQKYI